VAESPHTLHILYPDGTHHAISIVQATFTFGRGPENDLQLPDAQVSRRHARLLVEDEHVVLIDLKSANGTMIAGDRLDAEVPHRLRSGQEFVIGPYRLAVVSAPKTDRPPRPTESAPATEPELPTPATRPRAVDEVRLGAEPLPGAPPAGGPAEEPEKGESRPARESRPLRLPQTTPLPPQSGTPDEVRVGVEELPRSWTEAVSPPPSPPGEEPPGPPPSPVPEASPLRFDEVFGIPTDESRYLQYLPPIYQDQPFLGRFLLASEAVLTPIEQIVDNFDLYLDPAVAPPFFLNELAAWLGLTLDENWPVEKRRMILAEAAVLYLRRGTPAGLARHIEIYADVAPEILEPDDKPNHFEVILRLKKGARVDRGTIDRIILAGKPAHATYTLQIVGEG